MKITILCTDSNHPVVCSLRDWMNKISKEGHSPTLVFDKKDLQGGDILFLVSCSQLISDAEKEKYKSTIVLHASDLPKGKGWSPHIWSILNGEKNISVCALDASEPVDSGNIWLKKMFSLEGHELLPEINNLLFMTELSLMSDVVDQFETIIPSQQVGEPSQFMKKRSPLDSQIDPLKSIAEQFDLLRTVDSERYPAFFDYRGKRYSLKIEKIENDK